MLVRVWAILQRLCELGWDVVAIESQQHNAERAAERSTLNAQRDARKRPIGAADAGSSGTERAADGAEPARARGRLESVVAHVAAAAEPFAFLAERSAIAGGTKGCSAADGTAEAHPRRRFAMISLHACGDLSATMVSARCSGTVRLLPAARHRTVPVPSNRAATSALLVYNRGVDSLRSAN
jgi:hypothetical protein